MQFINTLIKKVKAGTKLNSEETKYLLEILEEHAAIAEEFGCDEEVIDNP